MSPRCTHTWVWLQGQKPPLISGKTGLSLPPFGAVTLRSCKPFGIILAFKPLQGPLVPVSAKDSKVTTPRNEVAPPPGVSAGELGFQKTRCLAAVLTSRDSGKAGKNQPSTCQHPGTRSQAPGPASPWSGAGKTEAEEVFEYCAVKGTVLQRGSCDIRAGLLRDPLALSCDPHTTFADSWSPSVGCACRSELAHWRGPGNALISLMQMRPGIS